MKPVTAEIVAALAFAVVGYFLGLSLGFTGVPVALLLGLAGSTFGFLIANVGARALWLPSVGLVLGFMGVVVVQVLAATSAFAFGYYVFFSLLTSVCLTLLASVIFRLFPNLRDWAFGSGSASH